MSLSTMADISIKEAAQRLGVTPKTITRWAESGHLPGAHKVNPDVPRSPWVIPEEAVQHIQQRRTEQANQRFN